VFDLGGRVGQFRDSGGYSGRSPKLYCLWDLPAGLPGLRYFDSAEKGEVIMDASSKIIDSKQPRAGAKLRIIQKETQRVVHRGLSDTGKTLVVSNGKTMRFNHGE
jgi:hypothetical protein